MLIKFWKTILRDSYGYLIQIQNRRKKMLNYTKLQILDIVEWKIKQKIITNFYRIEMKRVRSLAKKQFDKQQMWVFYCRSLQSNSSYFSKEYFKWKKPKNMWFIWFLLLSVTSIDKPDGLGKINLTLSRRYRNEDFLPLLNTKGLNINGSVKMQEILKKSTLIHK